MKHSRFLSCFAACFVLFHCGAARRNNRTVAPTAAPTEGAQCEVWHELQGPGDELHGRVDRFAAHWLVSLRLRVHLGESAPPAAVYGLGRVTLREGTPHCEILESRAEPSRAATSGNEAPRFDEELCLDEWSALVEVLDQIDTSVGPGQTLRQEERVLATQSSRRRRRRRLNVVAEVSATTELARDARGRAEHARFQAEDGRTESVQIRYTDEHIARCLQPNGASASAGNRESQTGIR